VFVTQTLVVSHRFLQRSRVRESVMNSLSQPIAERNASEIPCAVTASL
jgi:hypothetical protein